MTGRSTLASFALVLYLIAALGAAGSQPPVNQDKLGLALRGYDAVAYVAASAAVKGSPQFEHRWNGAAWRFASAETLAAFVREPERYAPQFGGYCAWAVSRGYTADGDPEAWTIVEGRLYLNYSKRVQRMWERDIPANIARARANWPGVLK